MGLVCFNTWWPPVLLVATAWRPRLQQQSLRACDQGFESAMLATSERRLAAIKTYFRLGFTPLYRGNGDGARWERVLGRVGSHDGKDGVL